MIKIAICDDDTGNNEIIKSYCDRISTAEDLSTSVELFNTGEDLLDYYRNNEEKFNIIFLDIEMGAGNKNGIETAKKIREVDNKSHIVLPNRENRLNQTAGHPMLHLRDTSFHRFLHNSTHGSSRG